MNEKDFTLEEELKIIEELQAASNVEIDIDLILRKTAMAEIYGVPVEFTPAEADFLHAFPEKALSPEMAALSALHRRG